MHDTIIPTKSTKTSRRRFIRPEILRRPNEADTYVFDTCRLLIQSEDDATGRAASPTVGVLMNQQSGEIVGSHVSFRRDSQGILGHCVADAIERSAGVSARTGWADPGVPKVVIVHGGLEFVSHTFRSLARDLDITIRGAHASGPTLKSPAERFFRGISRAAQADIDGPGHLMCEASGIGRDAEQPTRANVFDRIEAAVQRWNAMLAPAAE